MLEDSEEERVPGFPGARRTALLCSSEEHVESTHVATYASSRIQQDNYTKGFYVTTAGMNLSAGVTWQQICTTETCCAVCISVLVVAITIAVHHEFQDCDCYRNDKNTYTDSTACFRCTNLLPCNPRE